MFPDNLILLARFGDQDDVIPDYRRNLDESRGTSSQLVTSFYSERPRGAGFRSVNPDERWRENPARALARAGFLQHLECGIHRSESSPEGSFDLIPHPVARWAKLRHNYPICASTDDVLSIGSAEKQCLQTGRVCDVMEIPQFSRLLIRVFCRWR